MAELVRLKNLLLQNSLDSLEDTSAYISINSPFEFVDRKSGDLYEYDWSHLVNVEILEEGKDPKSLTGAAAGAVLGFLVAGPLGTAAGGLMGAGNAAKDRMDAVVGFSFDDGRIVTGHFQLKDRQKLQSIIFALRNISQGSAGISPPDNLEGGNVKAGSLSGMDKICPACAEPIRLKARKCRHCNTDFSLEQIQKIVNIRFVEALGDSYKEISPEKVIKRIEGYVKVSSDEHRKALLDYLDATRHKLFLTAISDAARSCGLDVEHIYDPSDDTFRLQDVIASWTHLRNRMPETEDHWMYYDDLVSRNYGVIVVRGVDNELNLAKAIGFIIIAGGVGVENSLELFATGFDFLKNVPSRLYLGDDSLMNELLRELNNLSFKAYPDTYCLNAYPNVNVLDNCFDLLPDASIASKRTEYEKSLGLDDVPRSFCEEEYRSTVLLLKDAHEEDKVSEFAEIETIASEDDVGANDLGSEKNSTTGTASIFTRVWKAVWFVLLNTLLALYLIGGGVLGEIGRLSLLIPIAILLAAIVRLRHYKKWDAVLLGVQLAVLIVDSISL